MMKGLRMWWLPVILAGVPAWPSLTAGQSVTRTEVVLVGGIHLDHLLHPQNSPAHLRSLIAKIRPDVLAIENVPEWQRAGRYYWGFLPEYYVATSYAAERSIPVVGIDWETPVEDIVCPWTQAQKAAAHRSNWIRNAARSQAIVAFGEAPSTIDAAQQKTRWEFLNSDDRDFAQDSANMPRENRIAANIVQVAVANPGKRVVVLIGTSHLFTQFTRLSSVPNIHLIESRLFVPLTPEEVNAAWRTNDLPVLLGANLESLIAIAAPQTRNHQRTRELLTQLARTDTGRVFAPYYEALWHLTMGRYDEAAALLDRVLLTPTQDSLAWLGTPQWAWPPLRRMQDKALLARASLHDLRVTIGEPQSCTSAYWPRCQHPPCARGGTDPWTITIWRATFAC